jgi:hypothetical protein
MFKEERDEDIDGNSAENPYRDQVRFGGRGFAFLWEQREYWRHWSKVKRQTGRWPIWSALFHMGVAAGLAINIWLFFSWQDSENWLSRQWLVGLGFAVMWVIVISCGRELVRRYEAKLYDAREEEGRHFVAPK